MQTAYLNLFIRDGFVFDARISGFDWSTITRAFDGSLIATAACMPGATYQDAVDRLIEYMGSETGRAMGLVQYLESDTHKSGPTLNELRSQYEY